MYQDRQNSSYSQQENGSVSRVFFFLNGPAKENLGWQRGAGLGLEMSHRDK